jgi:fructose/tagatose bisphosphate aldolase
MTSMESARALYARARTERFALGAFNVDNQETLLAIARAAAAKKSPVLVEASHGEVEMIGLRNLRAMVDNYKGEYGIEMYINLDHSPSVDAARAGIDAVTRSSPAGRPGSVTARVSRETYATSLPLSK